MAKRRKQRETPHGRLVSSLAKLDDKSAFFLFIVFLLAVLLLMDSINDQQALNSGKGKVTATELADQILSKFTVDSSGNTVALIQKDTINADTLDALSKMDYEQLKAFLGVNTDFVIQLQAFDGSVIPIGGKLCIGSREALVDGVPCS